MARKKTLAMIVCLSSLLAGSILFSGTRLGEASSEGNSSSRFDSSGVANDKVISSVTSDDKSIALTFDDGPDESTERLLDVLLEYRVRATFFVVGENCQQRPNTVKRMFQEGHEIGNHTYTHLKFRGKTEERIVEEIAKTNQTVFELTGEIPRFFRPPGGTLSGLIKAAAKRENLRIVLWTPEEDSKDWRNPGVAWIVKTVTEHARKGAIVLMHDGGGPRPQTLKSLPAIIRILQADGYHFVTISELLQTATTGARSDEPLK